jgi:hypothetical protein
MPKLTDLTDRKIGHWSIVSRAANTKHGSARWLCRCECGTERIVFSFTLLNGRSTNCGCKNVLDLTNKTFNRLTAISRHPENTKAGKAKWVCRCECGEETIVIGSHLLNGNTTSCGCAALEARSLTGQANTLDDSGARSLYGHHVGASQQRGIDFKLSYDEFLCLTSGNCTYCGSPPLKTIVSRKKKSPYVYNGIDRLDSNGIYEIRNCVSCCSVCNYSKRSMSYDEFLAWVSRVYHYQQERKRCA